MTKIVNLNTFKREKLREAFQNEKISAISNIFNAIDNSQFHETLKPKILLEAVKIYIEFLFDANIVDYESKTLMIKDLQNDIHEFIKILNGYSR